MTALSELLQALVGWLAELVRWLVAWCPRYFWVRSNQVGTVCRAGRPWTPLGPGVHWYIPNRDDYRKTVNSRQTLEIVPVTLQTADGRPVQVGAVITYKVVDPVKHLIENWDAEAGMAEYAQGALTEIITTNDWAYLMQGWKRRDGTRLSDQLEKLVTKDLELYGVEVERVRPTDQVQLGNGAYRVFGLEALVTSQAA